MKKVILVTAHYLHSRRKAGFHGLAEALWEDGWDVLFFTESLSWLSWLRGNYRFEYPVRAEANRLLAVRERLASFVWLTPWHPFSLRSAWLNRLSRPLFARYGRLPLHGIEREVGRADLFIFDSTYGLMLQGRFRALNPGARFVYRVSDDLTLMGNHPVLLETEARVAGRFDLVSAPCQSITRRLGHLPNLALHHHGVQKDLLDRPTANPYRGPGPHAVFAGQKFLDHDFLRRASRLLPTWRFHVIGPLSGIEPAANLHRYGELAFADLVPYLQHADVGLQALATFPGVEIFGDSLKVQQYTYCRLPIVAPEALRGPRPHIFYYRPGDDGSIRQALESALAFDRARVPRDTVTGWDEVARRLAGDTEGGVRRQQVA
jgi:2-beta-glucuronyltransferase